MILVLAVGFVGNGAQRWISIGPITIQPSEIAKLSIIMMLSFYFEKYEALATDRRNRKNIFLYGTVLPCIIIFIPIILVMLQKHLSCIIILSLIGVSMIIISGASLKYISLFAYTSLV